MSFETPIYIVLHIAAFAFFIALAFSGAAVNAGLMDMPNHRSNHKVVIPTAGGIGIIAGLGVGLLALSVLYPSFGPYLLLGNVASLLFSVGLLGLFDDVYDVNSLLKFLILAGLSALCVYVIGPPRSLPMLATPIGLPYWFGFLGAVLWMFVIANATNFMDGANGMMVGAMGVAFIGIFFVSILVNASGTAILSGVMAASVLGFSPYNFMQKARLFSGDIGSLTVGFGYGASVLLLVHEAPNYGLLYIGPLLVLPFLTDVLLNMLRRAVKREKLMSPHKTHLYQRMISAGMGHTSVSCVYLSASTFMLLITIIALYFKLFRSVSFLWFCISLFVLAYLFTSHSLKKRGK